MPEEYYLNKLYPFQDEILRQIQNLNVDFYLSGGTALSRCFLAEKYPFSWEDIIEEAKKKDLWVEPIEVSRIIKEFPVELLTSIKWVTQPDLKQAQVSLVLISEDILKGDQNSLVPEGK